VQARLGNPFHWIQYQLEWIQTKKCNRLPKSFIDGNKLAVAHQQNGTEIGGSSFSAGQWNFFGYVSSGIVSNTVTVLANNATL
jgi:hypothetical protein